MSKNTPTAVEVKKQRDALYKELKTVSKHKQPDRYYQLLARFTELAEQYCKMQRGVQS